MIMATVKNNINLDQFKGVIVQKDLKRIADSIFIPAMQRYIDQQTAITGGNYPALEPETIARKAGQIYKRNFTKKGNLRNTAIKRIESGGLGGFSNKTLIQTGKLIRSFFSINKGKNSVVISIKPDRKDAAKALQIDGVGNKKKKFYFFGITKDMERDAINYMKEKMGAGVYGSRSR